MTRPLERDYNSFVSYTRALEAYCAAKDAEIATLRAAAKQALEALQKSWNPMLRSTEREGAATAAIPALQSALETNNG
jgi:hypothetical protein